jgi:putative lipoic acid-binding regulatory protein
LNNDNLNNFNHISNEGHKIDFPVSYQLKVILDTDQTEEIHLRNLELVLEDAQVHHNFVKTNHSRKGGFVSFSMDITVNGNEQMEYLYRRLKLLPGLKFAI